MSGARTWFHLGSTNDFLGYMVRPIEHYTQPLVEGAGFLLGCPEEEVLATAGVAFDPACTDHWTLMVSPTIGTHVSCTIQDAGAALGFPRGRRDSTCAPLTATDGVGAPAEFGAPPAAIPAPLAGAGQALRSSRTTGMSRSVLR